MANNQKVAIGIPLVLALLACVLTIYNAFFSQASANDKKVDSLNTTVTTHIAVANGKQEENEKEHREFKKCITDQAEDIAEIAKKIDRKQILDSIFQVNVLRQLKSIDSSIKNGG